MKEIPYITVGNDYGGDQNKLNTYFQRLGACGAVSVADTFIHLAAKSEKYRCLNPGGAWNLTQDEFQTYLNGVKKYLYPRLGGISSLQVYMDGALCYAKEKGMQNLQAKALSASESVEEAKDWVRSAIDGGSCISFLLLKHQDPSLEEYTWHWFVITGYEETDTAFTVQIATWGKRHYLDFDRLWDCGNTDKGGLVFFS